MIKLRHFGDVLLITPLISTLKANYPHALIDVLVYGGTEVMLAGNKALYLTYTVDRTLKQQGLRQQYRGEGAAEQFARTALRSDPQPVRSMAGGILLLPASSQIQHRFSLSPA